jgi:O-antigen/teichoic acid export membrane protein
MRDGEDSTSGFGRGMLLLAMANAAYVVTAYATTTITARVLRPEDFGTFGVVMAWITLLTALLVKGVSTSTTREMAAGRVDAATAWSAGRSLGIRLAVALAVVGVAFSSVAADLFGSSDHAEQFAIGALGALTFGINAVLLAWPTGRRNYPRQAIAQVAYAVARVLLVVGGAIIGGLDGAVAGYVLAPLLASFSLLARRPAPTGDPAPVRVRLRRHALPVSLASIAVTAYFVVDVFALSAVVGERSRELGIYVAYGTVAHVPFFLLQAASIAIVPALAAARSAGARAAAIRHTMTDTLVLLAGPTLLLATAGDAASRVVFGAEYDTSSVVTLPLALATAAVTMIANLVAVEVAIGRLRESLVVAGLGAALLAAASWQAAERVDANQASAVAWAALAASALTALVLGLLVRVRHGALLEPGRALRGVALALVVALPPLLVGSDVFRMALAALLGIAWLVLVVRLGLVDLRRGTPIPVALEDPQPAS